MLPRTRKRGTLKKLAPTLGSPAAANKITRFSVSNPSGFSGAPQIEVYSLGGER